MKRPSAAAILWFVAFVIMTGLYARHLFLPRPVPQIMFARKAFFASARSGDDVYVYAAGTLTGDGVGYTNNTTAVTCYRDRMECLTYSVQQIGDNQVGRLDSPAVFPVIKWDQYEVVAAGPADAFNCRKLTISFVRTSETILWVEEPINQASAACKDADTRLLKWTIEDSPAWKALEANVGGKAGQR